MKKIELSELKYYLGTGLTFQVSERIDFPNNSFLPVKRDILFSLGNLSDIKDLGKIHLIKPIVYPLSMLTEEIEVDGEKFTPSYKLDQDYCFDCSLITEDMRWINSSPFAMVQLMIEWHFDVFGWINKGLAIDKSKL